MKTLINFVFLFSLILCTACGYVDTVKNTEQNYTPPALVYQPRFYYPEVAQEKYYTGNTKLYIFIDKIGGVSKAMVIKTSGYEILDNSAVEYVKSLKFNPAKLNDQPIDSRIVWEMKYNLSEFNWSVEKYLSSIDNAYDKLETVNASEKTKIEREILLLHNNFIANMNDRLNYNRTMSKVILPSLTESWRRTWDNWPLSFLLYHDFIQRFPDYDSLANVKTLLKNALKIDIQFINGAFANNSDAQAEKDNILMKIKKCIADNYPDIALNDLGFDLNKELKPITSKTDL